MTGIIGLSAAAVIALAGVSGPGAVPTEGLDQIKASATMETSATAAASDASGDVALVPAASSPTTVIVPALTPVSIEILEDVGSKINKSGDRFALRLAAPIVIDGIELVPAGIEGFGEVVHAQKNGAFGVPGELVLAARELGHGETTIRLRSLKIAAAGKGRTEGVGIATAVAGVPAMAVGLFIRGDQVMVAKGTVVDAKIATDFSVMPSQPVAPVDAPLAIEIPAGGIVPTDATGGNTE